VRVKITGIDEKTGKVQLSMNGVLSTRFHPDFPRDDIVEWVNKLSLFECQYLLDGINEVIYPESQTNIVPRMAYVHMIKNYIEKRMEELWNIEEMYFESNVKNK
jgi:hypothetical protein